MSNRELVQYIFNLCFAQEHPDFSALELYVSDHYQQFVDGQQLDKPAFMAHLRAQRLTVKQFSIRFISLIEQGDIVFSHHVVTVEKHDGSQASVEVLAKLVIKAQQLLLCDEVTQLLEGTQADAQLASCLE